MKFIIRIANYIIALILAGVVGIAVRLISRQKVKQYTGGWNPMDFSDLESQ